MSSKNALKKIKGLGVFTLERFPPLAYFPMILVFWGVFTAWAQTSGSDFLNVKSIASLVLTAFFFFKLRLYDEIKDYDHDLIHNKSRPLPRGVLTVFDLKVLIGLILIVEIVFSSLISTKLNLIWCGTILYSLLMFKEFFIGKYLRPHLTTYAVTHTFVTVLLACSNISVMKEGGILDFKDFLFSLASWPLFNIFEFGRKTYASIEEKPLVESYSKIFSPIGAVLLTLSQALATSVLLYYLDDQFKSYLPFFTFMFGALSLVGIWYIVLKSSSSAKLYRATTSIYIFIYYLIFCVKYIGVSL